jgi:antitoxin component of RelBE/YafQ-DinJ toxin-antitoxin module
MKNKETITITVNTGLKTAVMKILSKRGQTLSGFLNVYLINFIEENKRSENKKNNS